jgi:hypothetical protein
MFSQSMANKKILLLLKKNPNLCEINEEYPSLKSSSMPRHLCTNTQSLKMPEHISINKLSNIITSEHQEKNSNQHSKNVKEQTEVIELFQYKQEEEMKNKLYRKCRYQLPNSNDDEERDNTH